MGRSIKSNEGFSLSSVLVALAISGILLVGMMTMFDRQNRLYQVSLRRDNATEAVDLARTFLKDAEICRRNFLSSPVTTELLDRGMPITSITTTGGPLLRRGAEGIKDMTLRPIKNNPALAKSSLGRYVAELNIRWADDAGFHLLKDRAVLIEMSLNGSNVQSCAVSGTKLKIDYTDCHVANFRNDGPLPSEWGTPPPNHYSAEIYCPRDYVLVGVNSQEVESAYCCRMSF